jgi:hypothetical protein
MDTKTITFNPMTEADNKNEETEPQEDTAVECQCTCQGECQCGKYKTIRPVYYEVDVNQYINSLNDWD